MNKCLFSISILTSIWVVLFLFSVFHAGCVKKADSSPGLILVDGASDSSGEGASSKDTNKVRLDLFAMSKCPYFQKLILTIHPLIMAMGDRLDIKIKYIGSFTDVGIDSLQGDDEVRGDILQLCAGSHGSTKQLFDFMACQYEDIRSIPLNWDVCAQRVGIDPVVLEGCYKGDEGKGLIRESISASLRAGIERSPTVLINGSKYEKGILSASISSAVCKEFGSLKPEVCDEFTRSPEVRVTVLSDKRCNNPECSSHQVAMTVSRQVNNPVFTYLDYSDPAGQELFLKSGVRFLPIVVFDSSLEEDKDTFFNLERSIISMEGDRYVLPLGRRWEPGGEICTDGVDNTQNGMVDCDDPYCSKKLICRNEHSRTALLFTMSYCPYCTVALDFTRGLLDHFQRDPDKINFRIEFVGEEIDGDLYASHGDKEIQENLRQICAQKHSPSRYKFMEYIWCRNRVVASQKSFDRADSSWRSCLPKGMDARVIENCAKGIEGRQLLLESFKLSKELGINGSPVWMINNKSRVMAANASEIIEAYCFDNSDLEACKTN